MADLFLQRVRFNDEHVHYPYENHVGTVERMEPGETGVVWVRWDGADNLMPVAADWLESIEETP